MAVRNSIPSHLRKSPCRMCKTLVPALVNGRIELHPICRQCRAELDRQFRVATLQRNRQEAR